MNVVFNRAKAEKYMRDENPVQVLKDLRVLPKVKPKARNITGRCPTQTRPHSMPSYAKRTARPPWRLRFTMLCATRTGETRFAEWSEVVKVMLG